MGELANKAKKQSKFLQLEMNKGEIVKYIGYRFMPSNFDPSKETVQYELEIDGDKKYWTNGSTYVMLAFDKIQKGSLVTITREPLEDKNGNVIEGKSRYKVELFEKGTSTPPPTTDDEGDTGTPF